MNKTIDGKILADGQVLFDNMDSLGIPLDVALLQLDVKTGGNFAVDWVRFIDRALERKWLVYQIHDKMLHAMTESDIFTKEYIDQVMYRFKIHICKVVPEFAKFLKS